jgi:hypothetical protein
MYIGAKAVLILRLLFKKMKETFYSLSRLQPRRNTSHFSPGICVTEKDLDNRWGDF